MKRIVAGVVTIALMAGLLWMGVKQSPDGAPRESSTSQAATDSLNRTAPDPAEARLNTLLGCAWRGDVAGYLDSFSGPLRGRLEREVNERGRDAFAADLKHAARARKSHAIFAVEPEGPGAARITVETVYPDRNERQTYHLVQASTAGDWLVNDVETLRSQVPKAKYGTTASYQEPEGVPVQGLAVQGIPLRIETDLKTEGDNGASEGTETVPASASSSTPTPNP
jgi:hypothetical protein